MYTNKDEITIRRANKDDVSLLTKWWNDGSIMAHAGFPNGLGTNEDEVREKGPSQ